MNQSPHRPEQAGAAVRAASRLRTTLVDPGRAVLAVLWVVAVVLAVVTAYYRLADPTYPGMPWQDPHELADFRDTIYAPGTYLLNGYNPYDTPVYVVDVPWAQDFKLYAPAWLLLSMAFALLPFTVAAGCYLLLGVVLAVVFIRVVLRWAAPALLAAGTPIALIWFTLWSPSRYALQNSGTLLVMTGSALVVAAVVGRRPGTDGGPLDPPLWLAATGVALALLKPQFGLLLVVFALIGRRWDAVWRGIVGLIVASLPALVLCSVAAGGLLEFVGSVQRNLAHANSPTASTGLASPFNERTDVVGILARYGWTDMPGVVELIVPLLVIVIGALVILRRAAPLVIASALLAGTLLGLVHQRYDAVVLLLPAAIGLGMLVAGRRPRGLELAVWITVSIPVVHLEAISTRILTDEDRLGTDSLNTVSLVVCLALCVVAALRSEPSMEASSHSDAPSRTKLL